MKRGNVLWNLGHCRLGFSEAGAEMEFGVQDLSRDLPLWVARGGGMPGQRGSWAAVQARRALEWVLPICMVPRGAEMPALSVPASLSHQIWLPRRKAYSLVRQLLHQRQTLSWHREAACWPQARSKAARPSLETGSAGLSSRLPGRNATNMPPPGHQSHPLF